MQKTCKLLLCGLLLGTSVAAQIVPQNGLVAYYPFAGNSLDSTSNNYDLTVVNGATLCADRYGRENHAYQFDGIDDYLVHSTPLPQSGNFTLSFWYATDTVVQRGTLMHNGAGPSNGLGVEQNNGIANYTVPGNKIGMYAGGLNYHTQIITNASQWHHIVIRRTGSTIDLFYDDSIAYSGTFSINNPNGQFSLGHNVTDNNLSFKGKLDDFVLYNRALTLAEIDTLFNGCGFQVSSAPANTTTVSGSTAMFTVAGNPTYQSNYQWQMDAGTGFVNLSNSGPFSGVNNDTLIITNTTSGLNNNDFRVILTNDIGCKDTSASAKLMVTPNSINDIESGRVSVYPNPSRGTFVVRTNNLSPGESYTAKISNILGQQISVATLQASSIEQVFNLATPGIYFLEIVDKKHSVVSRQKIMVN